MPRIWIVLLSFLVPREERRDWREEWLAELHVHGAGMTTAWGALPDAWYLRTMGWSMDGMGRDFRIAVRGLLRRPLFTVLASLTLAAGIGANTAIFSVVDGVLLNPLPYPESDRLVSYNHTAMGLGVPIFPQSEATYLHYAAQTRVLESMAVFTDGSVNLIQGGEPTRLISLNTTADFFAVVGINPAVGRAFVEGDDRVGAEPVVVLGYALWRQSFGEDESVLGSLVEIDGVQRRIVGVTPRGFAVDDEQIYLPIEINDVEPEAGSFGMLGVGRLAPGQTVAAANTEMLDLMNLFVEANPDELTADVVEQAGLRPDVKPLKELYVEDVRQALWVLLGTVGFVLLIACANVANLFLVRAEARQREQAVRTAMGAGRGALARQYITEALILSSVGGLLGLGLAAVGVSALLELAPVSLPSALNIGIDGSVLVFTAAVSLSAGLLFGVLPLVGHRTSELAVALKDGGRSNTVGRGRHRMRSGLVVSQVALALVLLVGSGLMVRSFSALRSVDLGFESTERMTFRVGLPEAEYPEADGVGEFYRRLEERLSAMPGVQGVGVINGMPLVGMTSAGPMEPVDQPFPEGQIGPLVQRRQISPGYFASMEVRIEEGRGLNSNDSAEGVRAVVISRALANAFWPGSSAVGQSLRNQGDGEAWEVVGVAEDVRFEAVETEPVELVYLPLIAGTAGALQVARSADVVVHTGGNPLAIVASVREALRELDPRLPLVNPRTVETVVSDSMASTSFTVVLLGIAAGIALLLGTVGIYGVVSYIVGGRTQEIGVRMALGAPAATVLRSVVGEGLRLTGVGVLVGLVAAFLMSRALESLLYGVSATDPVTFLGTALLLTSVAAVASWIPARRASRVDPVEALRA